MTRFPLPGKQALLFLAGLIFYLLILFSAWRGWYSTPLLIHQERSKNFITLLLSIGVFVIIFPRWYIQILRGYSFRVWGDYLSISTHFEQDQTLIIEPFFGLAGKALIVNIECKPEKIETTQLKSFHLHKTIVNLDFRYDVEVFGHDGEGKSQIFKETRNQFSKDFFSNDDTSYTRKYCELQIPVENPFLYYSLNLKVLNSNVIKEISQYYQIVAKISVGVKIRDAIGHSGSFVKNAKFRVL